MAQRGLLQLGDGRRKKAEISPGAGRSPTGTAGKIGELFQACLEERKAGERQIDGRALAGRYLGTGIWAGVQHWLIPTLRVQL